MKMIDFEAMERRSEAWRKFAKDRFLPGVDVAELKPGMKVTISPNLMTHDRSYTDRIHEVVAVNSSHVQTRITDYGDKTRLVMLLVHEHHFYAAEGFEAA